MLVISEKSDEKDSIYTLSSSTIRRLQEQESDK